jgi:hypothetical protein
MSSEVLQLRATVALALGAPPFTAIEVWRATRTPITVAPHGRT